MKLFTANIRKHIMTTPKTKTFGLWTPLARRWTKRLDDYLGTLALSEKPGSFLDQPMTPLVEDWTTDIIGRAPCLSRADLHGATVFTLARVLADFESK